MRDDGDFQPLLHYPSGSYFGEMFTAAHSVRSGASYEGGWFSGKYHGRGTLKLANGDEYTGEWVHGNREGHGVYKYAGMDLLEFL